MAKKDSKGEYFFDRNPDIFDRIMEFYRTNVLQIPKTMSMDALKAELEFFGIDVDEDGILFLCSIV